MRMIYPKVQQQGKNRWKLLETIRIHSEYLNKSVVVLRGFVTDFASTPKFLWSILPPFGLYSTAALVHDKLYKDAGKLELKRKDCDKVFEELLIRSTCKKWKRRAMYYGVRIGGFIAWKKHRMKSSG